MRDIKFKAWVKDCSERISEDEPSKINGMRYTGIKDKKNKEIYEGDIIKHHKYCGHHEVKRLNDSAGFFIDGIFHQISVRGLSKLCENNIEIIGNIYENGELLK